ncbi:MAG: DNA topoisomerase I [Acidobacteria bacterium]|nr:MAG: DNA topoisomerase I [Acidobacteriota bacterium]
MTALVIVESPAKAKTINKYLGKDFIVLASMGHVRDLPRNQLGVDIEHNFTPQYITMPSKNKVINQLQSAAKKADAVYLAPDPDREGEAICWHLEESIVPAGKPVYRVQFNEITKRAIQQAIENPGHTDMNRVNAQQARRILDRLVGYKISPILWKKVKRGISAGRVQSVALRMIVDREYAILAFKPEEYWTLTATMRGSVPPDFKTKLIKWEGKSLRVSAKKTASAIENGDQAKDMASLIKASDFTLSHIQKKARRQNPPPPFTTSKLQQDASRSLGFSVKKTMMVAQRLYEGVEIDGEPRGLITYMRTDSTRVSDEALTEVRHFIGSHYPPEYLPKTARQPKQKKGKIQDGHEAIRPTHADNTPERLTPYLNSDELRLYTLIWKRFVASQMEAKRMNETVFHIEAAKGLFESRGLVTTFPGFSALYQESKARSQEKVEKSADLPDLQQGETLQCLNLNTEQIFTKPPARYSEASLVKALEDNGIGRPSTYAAIISTIQNRDYVEKKQARFHPTNLGMIVTDMLLASFSDVMDIQYTARMENQLDRVEEGKQTWQNLLGEFYRGFEDHLVAAKEKMPDLKREGIHTDIDCELCGKPTVIKSGKYGQFLSCSDYPNCKFAKPIKEIKLESTNMPLLKGMIGVREEISESEGKTCPSCGKGSLVQKRGKFGEFIACSNYPECRYIHRESTGVKCPDKDCNGEIIERKSKRGKIFYGCSAFPKCHVVFWDKPVDIPCPSCTSPFLTEKKTKRQHVYVCPDKECGYRIDASELPEREKVVHPQ